MPGLTQQNLVRTSRKIQASDGYQSELERLDLSQRIRGFAALNQHLEGWPAAEIAAALGLQVGHLYVLHSRALARLCKIIARYSPG